MYTCKLTYLEKLKVKHSHNCILYNFLPTRSTTTTTTIIQLPCSRPPFDPSWSHPASLFNVPPGLLPYCPYSLLSSVICLYVASNFFCGPEFCVRVGRYYSLYNLCICFINCPSVSSYTSSLLLLFFLCLLLQCVNFQSYKKAGRQVYCIVLFFFCLKSSVV